MALSEDLNAVLSALNTAIPEVQGCLIASTDGMSIAANYAGGDANRLAAMSATALGLGKRMCDTVGAGELAETSVTGASGSVYIYSTGAKGVLAVLASSGANVGLINLEARDAAVKIQGLLG